MHSIGHNEVTELLYFLQFLKPQNVDFTPRHKKKGRSKAGRIEKRKQLVHDNTRKQQIKDFRMKQHSAASGEQGKKPSGKYDIFNRFKKSKEWFT